MPDDILIIGGGLAGLSTAHRLNKRGHDVTLIEKRNRLGGRASSYDLDSFPLDIDNCQHILTGSCRYCLSLIRDTAGSEVLEGRRTIPVLPPNSAGRLNHWTIDQRPSPLHFLFTYRQVAGDWFSTFKEGLRLLALGLDNGDEPRRAIDWLRKFQSRRLIERLWRPLTTSALNETLERVSLKAFRKWVFTGLLEGPEGAEIFIPSRSLKSLYGDRVGSSLEDAGVKIHRGTRVRKIEPSDPGVVLGDGRRLSPSVLVSALPDRVLWARLPETIRAREPFSRISNWEHAPIISVHLLLDDEIELPEFALLSGTPFEWLFALRQPDRAGVTYAQCVKSAAWSAVNWSKQRLVNEARASMGALIPEGVTVTDHRVIKEKNATLSMTPRIERERFGPTTPFSSFFVAGDWVQQSWPPTMESAVRSGIHVASKIDGDVAPPADRPVGLVSNLLGC